MSVFGWNLLRARRDAGEPDWRRDYDAPDLAETRGTPAARSLNRRNCPHPRRARAQWFGADGYRTTICTDCGADFGERK